MSTPGDRGRATEEQGPGRDPRDNWFNNGANRLWKKHPVIFMLLFLSLLALSVFLRSLR
jgi:hypothetical protein